MRHRVDKHLDRLGGLLLPPRCVLCGSRGQFPCLDLCRACEQSLPSAQPVIADGPVPLQQSVAAFGYGHPVDHLVHALKYRGHLAVARVLGTLLGRCIDSFGLDRGIDAVIPVPLHPSRHAERSFNQSAEIARWAARCLQCRVDPTLAIRCRDTRPQVGLPREQRHDNLAGAFAAAPAVRGLRVAVVDDVTTTGNTVRELGQALRDAGALSVAAWCVCRAPLPEQVDLARDSEVEQA